MPSNGPSSRDTTWRYASRASAAEASATKPRQAYAEVVRNSGPSAARAGSGGIAGRPGPARAGTGVEKVIQGLYRSFRPQHLVGWGWVAGEEGFEPSTF